MTERTVLILFNGILRRISRASFYRGTDLPDDLRSFIVHKILDEVGRLLQPVALADPEGYRIDDPDFSNLYGSEDIYDSKPVATEGGLKCVGNPSMMTRVFVVNGDVKTECHVNRRSLNIEYWNMDAVDVARNNHLSEANLPVCLIETGRDTTVSVVFGDGETTRLGPVADEYVEVSYLSTKGSSANRYGVIGKSVEFNSGSNFVSSGIVTDFPGEVEVYLESNVSGGADFEDMDSIKTNAPAIFQSLERLTTKADYESFIKTITNPIAVRYGSAWGEAEECVRSGTVSVPGLMNCALVCALGSPYRLKDGNWEYLDLNAPDVAVAQEAADTLFVEGSAWEDFGDLAYFYLYLKQSSVDYNNYVYGDGMEDREAAERVKTFIDTITKHSQITVSNIYVPPTIHFFKIGGTISVDRYCDVPLLKTNLKNKIYAYLNANLNFGKPVYISNISTIVESFAEVKHCSLKFVPLAKNPNNNVTGVAGINFLYKNGTEDATEQEALQRLVTNSFRNYIQSNSGALDAYYKISLRVVETDGVKKGPDNKYTPTYKVYTSGGTEMTGLKVAENSNGFRDWLFENYVYNEREYARAVNSAGQGGKQQNPIVYERTNKLVDGFSKYRFLNEYMRPLYSAIASDSSTRSYLDDENNFMNYFSKMCDAMERVFSCSMLDDNGNIKSYSIDNEFAMISFDDSIVTQIGD